MKRLAAALIAAITLLVCDTIDATSRARAEFAGRYGSGDGLGMNVSLVLKPDGSYESQWLGCLGIYGRAAGRWHLNVDQISFRPAKETGMLKDFFREATVSTQSGQMAFVRNGETRADGMFVKESLSVELPRSEWVLPDE